jgi:hypothetical protein
VDPKELVAENGLEKQMENNIKREEFLGEMCLEKEMDSNHSKGLLAQMSAWRNKLNPWNHMGKNL